MGGVTDSPIKTSWHIILFGILARRGRCNDRVQSKGPFFRLLRTCIETDETIVTMTNDADAWVIWLHGLGDSGGGWTHIQSAIGSRLPWIKWSFPDAAEQRVTCNHGMRMRAWFDISTLPIQLGQEIGIDGETRTSSDALRDPNGLAGAVSAVHAMIAQAEGMGYHSTRIILGGFSQGAALALLAGRLYPKALAGIIAHSGWHLRQYYRPSETPNHATRKALALEAAAQYCLYSYFPVISTPCSLVPSALSPHARPDSWGFPTWFEFPPRAPQQSCCFTERTMTKCRSRACRNRSTCCSVAGTAG